LDCWAETIHTVIAKRKTNNMRKSRSSDEIEKLSSELSWSEQAGINSSFIVVGRGGINGGGDRNTNTNTNTNTSKTRRRNSTIERRKSVLLNSFNNNGSSIFNKKSSSLASSIKFPINAFTVENSAEFCNPTLFAEVYSMAFISACK
jgi:hypothetical protein